MGLSRFLPFGKPKEKINAIIVYPNKKIKKHTIEGNKESFNITEGNVTRQYVVDPKAIYRLDGVETLMYDSKHSSPLILTDKEFVTSMDSLEFRSIIESKAISDLLEAVKNKGGWDLHFIASLVSAIGVVILVLNSGGLGFLTGGGG